MLTPPFGTMKIVGKFLEFALWVMAMAFAMHSTAVGGYWDARFGQGPDGIVNAVAVDGSDVYVGGSFTRIGQVDANNIAKWDGNSWSALGSGVNNQVYALAVRGNDVYAGGKFTEAGSVSVNFIAKWNGSGWSALGSGLNNGVGGHVYALAVSPLGPVGILYVGGVFGGVVQSNGSVLTVNQIARWNGSSWSALGTGVNGVVYGITLNGSEVYVGGSFSAAGSVSTANVAKWSGSSWSGLADLFGRNGVSGYVHSIVVNGSDVYVGGNFAAASGGTVITSNIARFDGAAALWRSVGGGVNNIVIAMAPIGGNLYVGGYLTQAATIGTSHIAKWDGTSWSALGSGLNGTVEDLAVGSGQLYAVGSFGTADAEPSHNIAIWHEIPVQSPKFVGITFQASDCIIQFAAQPGREYFIQHNSSLNPDSWHTLGTIITGNSGAMTATHHGALVSSTRFYRVASP
jgi:hypothetical protein